MVKDLKDKIFYYWNRKGKESSSHSGLTFPQSRPAQESHRRSWTILRHHQPGLEKNQFKAAARNIHEVREREELDILHTVVDYWVDLSWRLCGNSPINDSVKLFTSTFHRLMDELAKELGVEFHPNSEVEQDLVGIVSDTPVAEEGHFQDTDQLKAYKKYLILQWDHMLKALQAKDFYNDNVLEKTIDCLINLTSSTDSSGVCSLMGLQLVTSIIRGIKCLYTMQFQRDVHFYVTILEEAMSKAAIGFIGHTINNPNEDIRLMCVQKIGMWIFLYQALFLRDSYLLHIGSKLDDEHAGVRKASLLALLRICQVKYNIPLLHHVSETYYEKIFMLMNDSDCLVYAVRLAKILVRNSRKQSPIYDRVDLLHRLAQSFHADDTLDQDCEVEVDDANFETILAANLQSLKSWGK